tara:strand:+ start:3581 stop:4006 length:426 start_codon:yes stop_codon:yes gene_type:complete
MCCLSGSAFCEIIPRHWVGILPAQGRKRPMISQWKKALVAIAFAVLAPLSVAQAISVPGGHGATVAGGSTISVGFSDPNQAGATVTITVSNDLPGPLHEETQLEIQLDADGKGSVSWDVASDWDQAVLFGGGASEMLVYVS